MTSQLLHALQAAALSLILAMVSLPLMIRLAKRTGLVDKPNKRKVHSKPIPMVGGILIFTCMAVTLLASPYALTLVNGYGAMMAGIALIFITGVWDDKADLSPKIRLLIQFLCALGFAAGGTRLTSLHGILGMYEIPVFWQYALTVIIIAGVTNAFNLMDGIDGLAGGLALINLTLLAYISYALGRFELLVLLAAASGALVIFLANNFQPARIFMGDGGSMMFGFLMSTVGITLIESPVAGSFPSKDLVLLLVTVILVVPVFDSLRVYAGRMIRGGSPFKADKTHLHHLFLKLGLDHRRAAVYIYTFELVLILSGLFLRQVVSFPLAMVLIISVFLLVCQLLELNRNMDNWTEKIRMIEKVN